MNQTYSPALPRRDFLRHLAVGSSALAFGPTLMRASGAPAAVPAAADLTRKAYSGPNLVIVRWGGGARRKESIETGTTYSPFLCHELLKRGTWKPKPIRRDDRPTEYPAHRLPGVIGQAVDRTSPFC